MNARCLAALAFLAAGSSAVSPVQAATGTLQDVQHVVILVQENRSFDHYYGCLAGTRGFSDPNALVFQNGNSVLHQIFGTGYLLPFHTTNQCLADVDHSLGSSIYAWDQGKWDFWAVAKGTNTMTYFSRPELPFYYSLAQAYTICDAYHCSAMGPTGPNRLYLMSGMIDPNGTGGGPVLTNGWPINGFTWTTYPERLQSNGVTWRVYQEGVAGPNLLNSLTFFAQYMNAQPGNPLYDRGMATVPSVIGAFGADVTNGTLPKVSWLTAPYFETEHPFNAPATGEAFVKQLIDILASKPDVYNSTVFILTYDENGGYFDHVFPPVPPPGTPDELVSGRPIGLGVRVPMIVISPWTRGGYVCSQVFDHTSILRFLEAWTGVREPNLSAWRRQLCGDLTSVFDFQHPNTNYPSLPSVSMIPCTNGIAPPVPSPQIAPAQEPGTVFVRPLPYQPNAFSTIDCLNSALWITMTNSGSASVHFAVYANAYRADGPWQYDVPAAAIVSDCFFFTHTAAAYDLTCYGPNGFNRRFAGNLATNCAAVDALPSLDLDAGAVLLDFQNPGPSPVTFAVTNALLPGPTDAVMVPAGSSVQRGFPVSTNNWQYDLTVTSSSSPLFLRRVAGYLELGPPALAASPVGGILLSYPAWAISYSLETTPDLHSGIWTNVGAAPVLSSNRCYVALGANSQTAFFRLRK